MSSKYRSTIYIYNILLARMLHHLFLLLLLLSNITVQWMFIQSSHSDTTSILHMNFLFPVSVIFGLRMES
jgi:hypothetical protein